MTDNIVVLRLPQGQTRYRARKEYDAKKENVEIYTARGRRVIRWKVSKDGETGKKKIGTHGEEHCSEK